MWLSPWALLWFLSLCANLMRKQCLTNTGTSTFSSYLFLTITSKLGKPGDNIEKNLDRIYSSEFLIWNDIWFTGRGKGKTSGQKSKTRHNGSEWINIQASKNLTNPPLEDQYRPVSTNLIIENQCGYCIQFCPTHNETISHQYSRSSYNYNYYKLPVETQYTLTCILCDHLCSDFV